MNARTRVIDSTAQAVRACVCSRTEPSKLPSAACRSAGTQNVKRRTQEHAQLIPCSAPRLTRPAIPPYARGSQVPGRPLDRTAGRRSGRPSGCARVPSGRHPLEAHPHKPNAPRCNANASAQNHGPKTSLISCVTCCVEQSGSNDDPAGEVQDRVQDRVPDRVRTELGPS